MVTDNGIEMLEQVDMDVLSPRDQIVFALVAAQLMHDKAARMKALMIAAMTSAAEGFTTQDDVEFFRTAGRIAAQGHDVFAAWAFEKCQAARTAIN
jgi:hypothetical protein